MINLIVQNSSEVDSDKQKAIATARMINYAATDASELGLKECSQLLYFAADLIKIKFGCDSAELLNGSSDNYEDCAQYSPSLQRKVMK